MGNELWAVYSKYEGLCLISSYEECKEIYDSEVQFMEDEGILMVLKMMIVSI